MMGKIELAIPVNPEYDFDLDPAEQPNYVNPVTLNNRIIYYANAASKVSDQLIALRRKLLEARIELRKATRAVSDEEYDILLASGLTKSDFKSLKDRQYFIRKYVNDSGTSERYATVVEAQDKLSDTVLALEVQLENGEDLLRVINQLSSNIQTHLSYVKNEMYLNRGVHRNG